MPLNEPLPFVAVAVAVCATLVGDANIVMMLMFFISHFSPFSPDGNDEGACTWSNQML